MQCGSKKEALLDRVKIHSRTTLVANLFGKLPREDANAVENLWHAFRINFEELLRHLASVELRMNLQLHEADSFCCSKSPILLLRVVQ